VNRKDQKRIRNLNIKIKYSPWVLRAMARDRFRCVDCGKTEFEKLVIHHIDESRGRGSINNKLNNLITVCRPCHSRRHKMVVERIDVIEMKSMGLTFREIGERLGISRQRAQQIYKKNLVLDTPQGPIIYW
jgi:hypothetical protein